MYVCMYVCMYVVVVGLVIVVILGSFGEKREYLERTTEL